MKESRRTTKLRDKSPKRKSILTTVVSNSVRNRTTTRALYKRRVKRLMGEKLAWLFLWAMLALLVMGGIYFRITTKDYSNYSVKVLGNYTYETKELEAPRGVIMDRNGTTLAYSETYYLLILEPKNIMKDKYYETTVYALASVLGVERERLEATLKGTDADGKPMADKGYYRYREEDGRTLVHISESQAEAFREMQKAVNASNKKSKIAGLKQLYKLDDEGWKRFAAQNKEYMSYQIQGVRFEKEFERVYPYEDTACKIIGYYTNDTSTGIENYYSEYLDGVAGKSYSYLDGDYNVSTQIVDEVPGNTVVSTIDLTVQKMVEESIRDYLKEFDAENVAVCVMNPNNGEILAMADDKMFNLNKPVTLPDGVTAEQYAAMSDEEKQKVNEKMYSVQRFYCTTSPYEPGSIFKPITVASALEENLSSPDDEFDCYGALKVRGRTIRCHNILEGGCGKINLMGTLENSCNVALMQIVFRLGDQKFDDYFRRFGFGQKTGIDLPGEESCKGVVFQDYTKMTELELATSSFGQGFAVTMVQMAAAFSSLVNGGYYYTPHVMREILSNDGRVIKSFDTAPQYTTISTLTSDYLKEALYSVVANGTGGFCQLEGYNIGGKTGTAELSPRGTDKWVASFISAAPIENPQLVVYAVVDRTSDPDWYNSSKPAQDLCKNVWQKILPYYNIHSNMDEYDYLTPDQTLPPPTDNNKDSYMDPDENETTEEETTEEETTEPETPDETPEETPSESVPEETPEETPAETPMEPSAETPEETLPEETPGVEVSPEETLPPISEEVPTEEVMPETPIVYETDPVTGYRIDPATGMKIEPNNGWLVDEVNGYYIDPGTGWYIDPDRWMYVDPVSGHYLDPATGETVGETMAPR